MDTGILLSSTALEAAASKSHRHSQVMVAIVHWVLDRDISLNITPVAIGAFYDTFARALSPVKATVAVASLLNICTTHPVDQSLIERAMKRARDDEESRFSFETWVNIELATELDLALLAMDDAHARITQCRRFPHEVFGSDSQQ